MLDHEHIHSLSDFQRNSRDFVREAKASGKPAILTINGHAEIVIQDVRAYQKLAQRAAEADDLFRLRRSLADYRAGFGHDVEDVLPKLEARHIPRPTPRAKPKKR